MNNKAKKIKLPASKKKKSNKIIKRLNDRHRCFCREYAMDWNGVRAYQKAYPKATYYAAQVNASKLLSNTIIKEYLTYLRENLEELTGITKARNLSELAKVAFSSIEHLHETWITRIEFDKLTSSQKACIQSIQSSTEKKNIGGNSLANQNIIEIETVKITLYDKLKAIDIINGMMGYNKPTEIKHTGELNSVLNIQIDGEKIKLE